MVGNGFFDSETILGISAPARGKRIPKVYRKIMDQRWPKKKKKNALQPAPARSLNFPVIGVDFRRALDVVSCIAQQQLECFQTKPCPGYIIARLRKRRF